MLQRYHFAVLMLQIMELYMIFPMRQVRGLRLSKQLPEREHKSEVTQMFRLVALLGLGALLGLQEVERSIHGGVQVMQALHGPKMKHPTFLRITYLQRFTH
jgi:hypothetical protein